MHWNCTDDTQSVSINLSENSSTQAVWGTVTYNGMTFPVTGLWQAAGGGGIAGRRVSNLQLSGEVETAPGVPDFIAVSGLIQGTNPNMGPFDLSVHSASTSTGQLNQTQAHLATPLEDALPAEVTPLPGGGADMLWSLGSPDGSLVMKVMVGGSGAVAGTVTITDEHDTSGTEFNVNGRWAASGSVTGRIASAFELVGHHTASPKAEDYLAAAGIMTGPGGWPQKIDISGNVAAISEYENTPFQAELLPHFSMDRNQLNTAYAESYMVIELGGAQGDSEAVSGWIGPANAGSVSPFGSEVYKSAGTAMSTAELAGIVSPDPTGANRIKVPGFQSAAGTRPVMIQFIGDFHHFPQPPLMEYHGDITKVFYDEDVGALVLQFADQPGGAASSEIIFNHAHGGHVTPRNHNSVIVEPL